MSISYLNYINYNAYPITPFEMHEIFQKIVTSTFIDIFHSIAFTETSVDNNPNIYRALCILRDKNDNSHQLYLTFINHEIFYVKKSYESDLLRVSDDDTLKLVALIEDKIGKCFTQMFPLYE